MAVSDIDIAKVKRFCDARVPEHARYQVRLDVEVDSRTITIVERRAPWRPEAGPEWTRFPIARMRYEAKTKRWTLYWRDRNLRFHHYDRLRPSASLDDLIGEVERDPTRIFWG